MDAGGPARAIADRASDPRGGAVVLQGSGGAIAGSRRRTGQAESRVLNRNGSVASQGDRHYRGYRHSLLGHREPRHVSRFRYTRHGRSPKTAGRTTVTCLGLGKSVVRQSQAARHEMVRRFSRATQRRHDILDGRPGTTGKACVMAPVRIMLAAYVPVATYATENRANPHRRLRGIPVLAGSLREKAIRLE